jgi:hypothetical protein
MLRMGGRAETGERHNRKGELLTWQHVLPRGHTHARSVTSRNQLNAPAHIKGVVMASVLLLTLSCADDADDRVVQCGKNEVLFGDCQQRCAPTCQCVYLVWDPSEDISPRLCAKTCTSQADCNSDERCGYLKPDVLSGTTSLPTCIPKSLSVPSRYPDKGPWNCDIDNNIIGKLSCRDNRLVQAVLFGMGERYIGCGLMSALVDNCPNGCSTGDAGVARCNSRDAGVD